MKLFFSALLTLLLTTFVTAGPTITHRVYFDVTHGGKSIGRIILGLYGEVAPMTVENFYELATNRGDDTNFTGMVFHRVIPDFMIQGGDLSLKYGRDDFMSIYGGQFPDETFELKHDRIGRLSMANAGKDTNGSQFFITTVLTPWLDGRHVVFGDVIAGMDVVDYISKVPRDEQDKPLEEVKVVAAGGMGPNKQFINSVKRAAFEKHSKQDSKL